MGQVAPLGAMTDTQGATSSKGVRGGLWTVKKPKGGEYSDKSLQNKIILQKSMWTPQDGPNVKPLFYHKHLTYQIVVK